jgi:hypothetical protein
VEESEVSSDRNHEMTCFVVKYTVLVRYSIVVIFSSDAVHLRVRLFVAKFVTRHS